jgi:hypothetical protein
MADRPSVKVDDMVSGPAELADKLGVTLKTFESLATERVAVRIAHGQYLVFATIKNYIERLRRTATGREGESAKEKQRLLKAQADRAEMQLKVERKDLVSFAEGVATAATMSHLFKSSLLAARTRLAGQLSLSRSDSEIVYEWACGVLKEISEVNGYADHLQAVAQEAVEKELATSQRGGA